jgi:tetratricopeptide (TPR) repeat protein
MPIWRACPEGPERRHGEGLTLLDLGSAALVRADNDEAGVRFEESLALWRELGDDWGIASALEGLGRAAQRLLSIEGRMSTHAEVEEAKQLYEQSLAIREKIGDAWGVARAYLNLARIEFDRGAHEQATESFQQALARAHELRDFHTAGVALMNLGSMAIWAGQAVEAEEPLTAALTIYRQVGAPAQSADALYWLGDAAMLREVMDLASAGAASPRQKTSTRGSATWTARRGCVPAGGPCFRVLAGTMKPPRCSRRAFASTARIIRARTRP